MSDARPGVAADDLDLLPIVFALIAAPRIGPVPVGRPLPCIADHIENAVRALSKDVAADGRQVTLRASDIGFPNVEFHPPGVAPSVGSAGGLFPFRFGRKAASLPIAVILSLLPTNHDDGKGITSFCINAVFP